MTDFADQMRTTGQRRPKGAAAWGSRDEATNTLPVYTEAGLWFTIDLATGRDIAAPASPVPSDADYASILHDFADRVETISRCYFIGASEGPVKIGHSVNVEQRLRAFQMGCPVKLEVLATARGGEDREAAYHWQFREHRAHGEWFERCPAILAEIDRLTGEAR